ncbi:MAG: gas vesicle protein GvpG [Gemmatimonadaceae bacterium]
MGLLTNLLFFPIAGPAFAVRWSLGKVRQVVDEELTDDSAIKQDLMELQMLLELGDIDEEEYLRREAVIMERLRDVRRWREELGMSVMGGPVRVARSVVPEE